MYLKCDQAQFKMPAIEMLIPPASSPSKYTNPLPPLLQTHSGLAILEIQGTIHGHFQHSSEDTTPITHQIGRLEFPLYNPQVLSDDGWMKKVYLYVGKSQRLTGEVKKLGKPLGILRKVERNDDQDGDGGGDGVEALEIVDIVKFKVLFSGRPEPVGE